MIKLKRLLPVLLLCIACPGMANAQSTTSKVLGRVVNHMRSTDLVGIWDYKGAAVAFESDSFLKKAGGAVAAASTEKNLDKQLEKLGIKEGSSSYEFTSDSTFTHTIGATKLRGKYSYNQDSGYITLRYMRLVPVKAQLKEKGKRIEMLFDSSEFLTLITFLGGHSGVKAVKAITSIANSYDGMLMGFELQKR